MAKVEKYKGIPADKLKGMSVEEIMPMLKSRARRTLKRISKNPQYKKLMKKASKVAEEDPSKVIKTHVREAVIIPGWLGLTFGVHNGKEFKTFVITAEKVGHRLGDYSPTTQMRIAHSGPGVGATRGSKFIPLK